MAYEIREIEEVTYLVDTIRESILTRSLDSTEERLRSISVLIKKYGYPVNKETLIGALTKGIKYFEDIEAKKIEDFAKGSPLARTSIERMKEERIAEVIPIEFGDTLSDIIGDIVKTWQESKLGGLSEEDYIYKEKEISLDRRNIIRKKLDLYSTKLTEAQIDIIGKVSSLLADILSLEDKGVIVFNTNWGRKGLLANFESVFNSATIEGQISEGELASLVLQNMDGMTRTERLKYVPGREHSDHTKPETQTIPIIPQVYGSYRMNEGESYGTAIKDKD